MKYKFIKDYIFMSGLSVSYTIPKGSILKQHENKLWYSFDPNGEEHPGCFNNISHLVYQGYIQEYDFPKIKQ